MFKKRKEKIEIFDMTSDQLIPGKWYRCYTWTATGKAKYKEISEKDINKILNIKENENTTSSKSNEIQGSNIQRQETKGRGTIAISNRRQQVAIGRRPQGNETFINKCRTKIDNSKIRGATIFSGHNQADGSN